MELKSMVTLLMTILMINKYQYSFQINFNLLADSLIKNCKIMENSSMRILCYFQGILKKENLKILKFSILNKS